MSSPPGRRRGSEWDRIHRRTLRAGDVVELGIDGLGVQRQEVRAPDEI